MFSRRLPAALASALVFLLPGSAFAVSEKAFVQNQLCQNELLAPEDFGLIPVESQETRMTVMPEKTIPGRHGGELTVLRRREGMSWTSSFQLFENAVQGDPRWFILIAGKETARFFGFEMQPDGTLTVPGAVEMANAIAKVNRELVRMGESPIPMTFVKAGQNELNSVEFATHYMNGEIPLASGDNVEVHDVSFHTGAIFMPPGYFRHALLQASAFRKFTEHVEKEIPELANDADYLRAKKEAFEELALQFDLGTGNFTRSLAGILKTGESRHYWLGLMFMNSLFRLTGFWSAPAKRLEDFFPDYGMKSASWHPRFKEILYEFTRSKKVWMRFYDGLSGDALQAELLARLKVIQTAVQRVEKPPI